MKVLLLSCNTGGGHNAACRAVRQSMENAGIECCMMDALEFAPGGTSKFICGLYENMVVKTPKMFGMVYRLGSTLSTQHMVSPVYLANAACADRLAGYIVEKNIDAVVASHVFPGEALTYIKKHRLPELKFYLIATDYTCVPFTEEGKPDKVFIPHRELTGEFSDKGIPDERLAVTGIPVDEKFRTTARKAEARAELGIEGNPPVILIMTGSMGFGNAEGYVDEILKIFPEDVRVIVLGGNNEKLKSSMRMKYGEGIRVEDFTDRVPLFMDASDVTLTKPGGLSSTEAAVKNIPVVHTAAIPGCETKNAEFFQKMGMAIYADTASKAAKAALMLWENTEIRENMLRAQRKNTFPDAADKICSIILKDLKFAPDVHF